MAGAIRASVGEVRQFQVVDALNAMTTELKKDLNAAFTGAKMFRDGPVK